MAASPTAASGDTEQTAQPMIVLGRIAGAYGVQGWVRLHPFGDDPLSWRSMPQWWLSADDGAEAQHWQAFTLRNCRTHGKSVVAALEEVGDRDAAEALAGFYVGAPRAALPKPAENEYYWADLIGLEVRNTADEALGTVSGLISTGAHDVLQLRDEAGEERLIPFVAAYVLDVDEAAKLIRVDWNRDW